MEKTPSELDHEMEKTPKELDDEIAEYLAKAAPDAGRYMLVDNRTGKDLRIAHDFEVKQIQSKRHGIAMQRPLATGPRTRPAAIATRSGPRSSSGK